MKNERLNSAADGAAEDLIRSIMHLGASEYHALSLYQKKMSRLVNGLDDVEVELDEKLSEAERYREELLDLAELRRDAMMILYEMYDGDKDLWCQVKHLSIAYITAVESYQSSEDIKLLELATKINEKMNMALTGFLGTEITDCASCLGDFLKGVTNDSSKQEHEANFA